MSLPSQQPDSTRRITWQPIESATALLAEEGLLEIASLAGSLTQRLRELCDGDFRLRLLDEQPGPDQALVREVLMLCGDKPWVYAQTVIPGNTLTSNPWIASLGERPLGDTLFDRPGVQRHELFVARLEPGHLLFDQAMKVAAISRTPPHLLARRSVIQFIDSSLTINELFFPGVGQAQHRSDRS